MRQENPTVYYKDKVEYDRDAFIIKTLEEYVYMLEKAKDSTHRRMILEDLVKPETWTDYKVVEEYEEVFDD